MRLSFRIRSKTGATLSQTFWAKKSTGTKIFGFQHFIELILIYFVTLCIFYGLIGLLIVLKLFWCDFFFKKCNLWLFYLFLKAIHFLFLEIQKFLCQVFKLLIHLGVMFITCYLISILFIVLISIITMAFWVIYFFLRSRVRVFQRFMVLFHDFIKWFAILTDYNWLLMLLFLNFYLYLSCLHLYFLRLNTKVACLYIICLYSFVLFNCSCYFLCNAL